MCAIFVPHIATTIPFHTSSGRKRQKQPSKKSSAEIGKVNFDCLLLMDAASFSLLEKVTAVDPIEQSLAWDSI